MKVTVRGVALEFDDAARSTILGKAPQAAGSTLELADALIERDDRYIFVCVVRSDGGPRPVQSSELCGRLARVYRDTFFYHSFCGRAPKRIEFAVLVATGVDDALVYAMQDELRRRIPITHPAWQEDSAWGCVMMTPRQWERRYGRVEIKDAAEG